MAEVIKKPVIGTHNSMTYLPPARWYMWFMIPFARCQRAAIEEQWKAGARVFDIRLRFDREGNLSYAHGLYHCRRSKAPGLCDLLGKLQKWQTDSGEQVYVRLILEDSQKEYYQASYFIDLCAELEDLFPGLTFYGGNRKGDWKKLWKFRGDVDDTLNNQWVSSMAEDARWYEKALPFAYARRCNKRNKEGVRQIFNLFDFLK